MAAINEEFAGNEELIQDGDVVAFIPPVSGG
ncbi:MoaD/ThiS family protein [Neobacillus sp. PS3-34]